MVNYQDNAQFGLNGFYSKMDNLIIQDRDTSRYKYQHGIISGR